MSTTGAQTTTYTRADVRRVVENFAADYAMIADLTNLSSRDSVEKNVTDLRQFAEDGYLVRVTLYLMGKEHNPIKVAVFNVSENAVGWQNGRPGNNGWDAPAGSYLQIMATLSDDWWNKSEDSKSQYLKNKGFSGSWSKSEEVISLTGLTATDAQRYVSNGYGWARTNYSK